MWLFDTIFLDQNNPTAVLDPQAVPTIQEKKVDTTIQQPLSQDPSTTVSPDIIVSDSLVIQDIPSPDLSVSFLSGGDTTAPLLPPDGVTFDIGWYDVTPILDTQASPQDAHTDVTTVSPESDAQSWDLIIAPQQDISIALVQGATSAQSDVIMETVTDDVVVLSEQSNTVIDPLPMDTTEQKVSDTDTGLMWLFGNEALWGISEVVETPDGVTDNSIAQVIEDIPLISSIGGETLSENIGSITTTETTSMNSQKLDTLTYIPSSHSASSPLQEMLMEFIVKLEAFNTETNAIDADMTSTESSLIQEQDDLKHEFDIRMSAIEYKRKHINEIRADRIAEKTRLERIIAHLKQEVV